MSSAASALNFPEPEGERVLHLVRGGRIEGKIISDQDLQVDCEVNGARSLRPQPDRWGQSQSPGRHQRQPISIVGTVEGGIERRTVSSYAANAGLSGKSKLIGSRSKMERGALEVIQPKSVGLFAQPERNRRNLLEIPDE